MKFELGIDSHIDDYFLMEKILYRADSDEIFEEFEVDYILLAKKEFSLDKVKASINKDEVSDVQFLSKDDLKLKIELGNMSITPWFKLIMKNKINEIFEKGNEEEKVYSGKENKIIRYI